MTAATSSPPYRVRMSRERTPGLYLPRARFPFAVVRQEHERRPDDVPLPADLATVPPVLGPVYVGRLVLRALRGEHVEQQSRELLAEVYG